MTAFRFLLLSIALCFSLAFVVACSGGGSSDDTNEVSFALSDAPIEGLDSVTITIESMTVNREGEEDIVIDTFDDEDGNPLDRVTVDLLDYQGSDSKIILFDFELEIGDYQNIRLEILDENTDDSYVLEIGDAERKLLKVPSDQLKLGGFEVESGGAQFFVIEFNLPRSMTYNPGPDRYILKPRGVRVVDVEAAAEVRGVALGDLLDDCDDADEGHANRVYLYKGHGLDATLLGDAFDPDIDDTVPAGTIEPYASEDLDEFNAYEIGFVNAGNYTLAFSCNAAPDDADFFDDIPIPAPENQLTEITLEAGDEQVCDFELAGVNCI
ncbi:MAG: DUF4382 domain-containing protein [Deltaproteobacteria bacterium]|nr:DUF4382 domain-containing protein [Deltaproteobacteria bacterium]MBW2390791.1 DUF4382 domain-containing protein [Deltaproteobacteria bacterium]MBW2725669.1 DUF4382 domain-containing protein [Deltaproteobacteria bacterium]